MHEANRKEAKDVAGTDFEVDSLRKRLSISSLCPSALGTGGAGKEGGAVGTELHWLAPFSSLSSLGLLPLGKDDEGRDEEAGCVEARRHG